jgi:hypothetical protein
MCHAWESRDMHTEFWRGNLKARDNVEYLGVDGSTLFRWILKGWDLSFSTGFMLLWVGSSGGLL